MKFRYVLFDLDGTLSESGPGITRCVQHALKCCGIDEPDRDKLRCFVGPPLNYEFKLRYGMTDKEAEFAVTKYRELYDKEGYMECRMYDGTQEMLRHCREAGMVIGVASSKPEAFVIKVLKMFGIFDAFDVVVGSFIDEEFSAAGGDLKEFIVKKALGKLERIAAGEKVKKTSDAAVTWKTTAEREQTYGRSTREMTKDMAFDEAFLDACAMIGDTHFDMEGAAANKVHAIGVSFGYGTEKELRDAGAEFVAASPRELEQYLTAE